MRCRKDPDDCLRNATGLRLKTFFIWYASEHPEARRLNTYISYWKWMRQLHYNLTGTPVKDEVGASVSEVRSRPIRPIFEAYRGRSG